MPSAPERHHTAITMPRQQGRVWIRAAEFEREVTRLSAEGTDYGVWTLH
jgi:hypothetical protein